MRLESNMVWQGGGPSGGVVTIGFIPSFSFVYQKKKKKGSGAFQINTLLNAASKQWKCPHNWICPAQFCAEDDFVCGLGN